MTTNQLKADFYEGYVKETNCGTKSDAGLRMVKRINYTEDKKPKLKLIFKSITGGEDAVYTKIYLINGNPELRGVSAKYRNGATLTVWDRKDERGVVQKATCIEKGNTRYIDFDSDGKIDCMENVVSYI